MSYEIWIKAKWQEQGSQPLVTCMTLDLAIEQAKLASSKKTTSHWRTGTEDIFVLNRTGMASSVRGFGMNGKFIYAVANCKRCNNSGRDASDYSVVCKACQGASWKHTS